MSEKWARPWFAATAACAFAGVLIGAFVASNNTPAAGSPFQTGVARAFNSLTFFTIVSNLLVLAACLLLAIRPQRESTAFDVLRVTSLVAIAVTGIVYHAVLAQLLDLKSWSIVQSELSHTITPVMAVAGWLIWGPRKAVSAKVVWLSLIFPALWVAFTLIRGAVIDWYPYPFINVSQLGYAHVALNCVWVALLMLGCAGAIKAWEARQLRLSRAVAPDPRY
jgi:hypothetical protein